MNKNQSKVVDLLISSYALTDKEFKLISEILWNAQERKKTDEITDDIVAEYEKKIIKAFAENLLKEKELIDLGCGAGCYEYVAVEDIEYLLKEGVENG